MLVCWRRVGKITVRLTKRMGGVDGEEVDSLKQLHEERQVGVREEPSVYAVMRFVLSTGISGHGVAINAATHCKLD